MLKKKKTTCTRCNRAQTKDFGTYENRNVSSARIFVILREFVKLTPRFACPKKSYSKDTQGRTSTIAQDRLKTRKDTFWIGIFRREGENCNSTQTFRYYLYNLGPSNQSKGFRSE